MSDFINYIFPSRDSELLNRDSVNVFPYIFNDAKNELLYYEEKYDFIVIDVSSCYSENDFSRYIYSECFLNELKLFLKNDGCVLFYSGNNDSKYKLEAQMIINSSYSFLFSTPTLLGSFYFLKNKEIFYE